MPAVSLRVFPPSLFRLFFFFSFFFIAISEPIRSTLKLHFTPSNYTQAKVASGRIPFLPFIPRLSPRPISSYPSPPTFHPLPSLPLPVYFRAVPPFVFIRAIGKGVRSRASYLFSCFTA
ncbi:unnamed protein product [Lasius platythorax]|uniref:Secreted protein n=1 Tax=Lasius platythorax TaxID=488582 RepID=A0AAV2P5Z4_9HYME